MADLDIERLLQPIPGENPAGENLYYSPVYDKIKEARRQEDSGPMGAWEREAKSADYKLAVKLIEDALVKKTKDLQLAAWLLEAWSNIFRLPGLTAGLRLNKGLLETFWENVYPEIEDGDVEMRASPLEWVGSYFDPSKGSSPILAVRTTPLTLSNYNYLTYQEGRRIGFEAEVKGNKDRTAAREAALKEKKIAPEVFDKDFEATPKAFYRGLEGSCKAAAEAVEELDALCAERFGAAAPGFGPLKKAISEVDNVVHILLLKKLEKEPDPPEPVEIEEVPLMEVEAEAAADGTGAPGPVRPAGPALDLSALPGGQIGSADHAALYVLAAAQYFRRSTPASPVSYLMLRALRWGEVRDKGDVSNLPAPGPDVRIQLRNSAMSADWKRALETAENAMSTPCGRGWLDLQRYAISACDQLGYAAAAKALRCELKAFLADFPTLPAATLSDDTGTANPETLAWLKKETIIP